MSEIDPPLALLAELTHRCPLACPYCSNPLALERSSAELDPAATLPRSSRTPRRRGFTAT